MPSTLTEPRNLGGPTAVKLFFGVGLAIPVATGMLSLAFLRLGLMSGAEVYPWDQVLSVLFLTALFITPESICVYLFKSQIIRGPLARLGFVVIVVFLYGNYILLPPSVYTALPVMAATLLWALWPPAATLAAGLLVGRIEARQIFDPAP
jgi:hypothetical protein